MDTGPPREPGLGTAAGEPRREIELSAEEYAFLLRMAVASFFFSLVLGQWLGFRELRRRGSDETVLASCHVRDHVLAGLARGSLGGLAVTVPLMVVWGIIAFNRREGGIFLGMELFLAFLLVAVGLAAVMMRLALDLAVRVREEAASRLLLWLRLGALAAAAVYGAALWVLVPAGLGEMLLSVFLVGAALVAVGLNRTAQMTPQALERLALFLTRRR